MANTDQDFDQASENEQSFNIKKLVGDFLSHWYLFLLGIIVCGGLAVLFARYSTPSYKINSKITIDDGSSGGLLSGKTSGNSLLDFSDLLDISSNAYNEIDILKSRALMTSVVKDLNLNVTIYRKGRLNSIELYDEAPFKVQLIPKVDSIIARKYDLMIDGDKIHLKNGTDDIDTTVTYGAKAILPQFDLVFTKVPGKLSMQMATK